MGRLVPYIQDPATGAVRVPKRIEHLTGIRVRTREDLGRAAVVLLRLAVRGELERMAAEVAQRTDVTRPSRLT